MWERSWRFLELLPIKLSSNINVTATIGDAVWACLETQLNKDECNFMQISSNLTRRPATNGSEVSGDYVIHLLWDNQVE